MEEESYEESWLRKGSMKKWTIKERIDEASDWLMTS